MLLVYSVDVRGSIQVFFEMTLFIYFFFCLQLGVYIMLNSNSLTKQVIFSPFYSLANNCPYAIEFRENQAENVQWITVSLNWF